MKQPVHNAHAPDIFADAATGFFTFNGNMRVTFEVARSNYSVIPIEVDRIVIGRLVMPLGAAEEMAKGILKQIEEMKAEPKPNPTVSIQ